MKLLNRCPFALTLFFATQLSLVVACDSTSELCSEDRDCVALCLQYGHPEESATCIDGSCHCLIEEVAVEDTVEAESQDETNSERNEGAESNP